MKWNAQAIVAIMLGAFLLSTVLYQFVIIVLGKATPGVEDDALWVDLLKTAVGGLLVYIGAHSRGNNE